MNDTVVRARIDRQVKADATAVLAEMGLTLSDGVRMALHRIARDKTLPFHPMDDFEPGPITRAAMLDTEMQSFDTVDELFAHLHAED